MRFSQAVSDQELRAWNEISEEQKEMFRRSAQSLALPEQAMLEKQRREMAFVFKKKLSE